MVRSSLAISLIARPACCTVRWRLKAKYLKSVKESEHNQRAYAPQSSTRKSHQRHYCLVDVSAEVFNLFREIDLQETKRGGDAEEEEGEEANKKGT